MKKTEDKDGLSKITRKEGVSQSREFRSSSNIPKRPTFRRNIRALYLDNKVIFFALIGVIVILVGIVAAGLFGSKSSRFEVETTDTKYWLTGPIESDRLLSTFIENSFSGKGSDFIQSVRLSGNIVSDGRSSPFFLLKKRPGYAIFRVDLRPGFELMYGVNQGEVWGRLRIRDKEDEVYSVTGQEAEQISALATFLAPFVALAVSASPEVGEISLSEELGEPTVRVEFVYAAKGANSVAHLNVENLQVMQRVDVLPDGSVARVDHSDYRKVDGIWFPFESAYYVNDVLTQEIILEVVTLNPGIVTSLFEAPEGLDSAPLSIEP